MKRSTLDNVRAYWRRRYRKVQRALEAEKKAHESTRASKLLAVQSDPNMPKGTIMFLDVAGISPRGAAKEPFLEAPIAWRAEHRKAGE